MLKGKTALITGGSRGIGEAIALKMAEAGADIAVVYASSDAAAISVTEKIRSLGRTANCYKCNVADFNEAESTVKQILADFGRIDILVNNAGITRDKLMIQMTEDDYDSVLDVNLKGSFNMIRHTSRSFIKQKSGRIINISSIVGLMGNAGQVNYSASKSGLIGLTKSVAKELAAKNITCNAIAPGFIETPMTEAMTEEVKERLISAVPLKRTGTPDDVAALVIFLASDTAGYITGEVIKIDGGLYI